ncbi:phospholipid-transporting ATPase ABCA3-like [Dermacentor andersoni]|uniref:phospholipid-transporting ATPase ABCA3-like n=1 Tax=Dermacentor andersoni TaxID=34620 RepID=UPI0024170457|nr:phospholipid-transporting ATPase ABCA3-like [Dermacentor andersoni]
MQLLTGLSESSSGDVYLGSLSLSRTPRVYASKIGYCPDTLGLPDHLTGREIIELFCVLRGFRLNDTTEIVMNLLRIMELTTVANDITSSYTPGDKRKLCIALAIAGRPSVVLLDEPSTGVDVAAKAQIRRSLSIVRQMTDCAILLTSNSMQQCEVLCDRIAILLAGQLECIGTVDELKSKFGRGYTITIKLRQDTFEDSEYREDLTQDMMADFHSCQLDHSFQASFLHCRLKKGQLQRNFTLANLVFFFFFFYSRARVQSKRTLSRGQSSSVSATRARTVSLMT